MSLYGHGGESEPDGLEGSEIQPKVPSMDGGFWSSHISRMTFQKIEGEPHPLTRKYYFRSLYKPSSTIYRNTEIGTGLTEKLTSGTFDKSKPSTSSKEVRPFDRHEPARGHLSIRSLGGYKYKESNYMKR